MNKVYTALTNALKMLSDNHDACKADGYHALAADMKKSMVEIQMLLMINTPDGQLHSNQDYPLVKRGLDGKLYLVFQGNWDAGNFLNNLGISEYSVPLYHMNGFENAILIDTDIKKPVPINKNAPVIKQAETWLRAVSSWLLENDYDMILPDGVLDTDPLDIADDLQKLSS